jgi:hypothetical protein
MDWIDMVQAGTNGRSFEHGNEPLVSIKCFEILGPDLSSERAPPNDRTVTFKTNKKISGQL